MPSLETICLLVGLAGLALFIWLLSLISSAIYCSEDTANSESRTGQPDNFQGHAGRQNAVTAITNAIHSYRRARHAHERQSSKREKLTIAILAFTAFFAFAAAAVGFWSAWSFQGQLNAMQQANEDGRKALIATQRAFVGVHDVKLLSTEASDASPSDVVFGIATIWENTGNTETIGLELSKSDGYGVNVFFPPFPDLSGNRTAYTLSPKGTVQLTGAWADESVFKTTPGYLTTNIDFGLAQYSDAFGQFHFTMSCRKIVANNRKSLRFARVEPCQEYNCADKECEPYGGYPYIKRLLDGLAPEGDP